MGTATQNKATKAPEEHIIANKQQAKHQDLYKQLHACVYVTLQVLKAIVIKQRNSARKPL